MAETGQQDDDSPEAWGKLYQQVIADKKEHVENVKKVILSHRPWDLPEKYRAQYAEVINDLPFPVEKWDKDELLRLVTGTSPLCYTYAGCRLQDGTSGYKYVSKECHAQLIEASNNKDKLIRLVVELFIKLAIHKPTPKTFLLMAAMVLMYTYCDQTKEEKLETVKQIRQVWKYQKYC